MSTLDSKWLIWNKLELKDMTKTGLPKIKLTDKIKVSDHDFTMKSNSNLDGKSQIKYLVDYYSKITDKNKLRVFSEHQPFVKAMKFTGTHSILNSIIEPSAHRKLQERWLLKNCYEPAYFPKKSVEFINANEWAEDYLSKNGVSKKRLDSNLRADVSAE